MSAKLCPCPERKCGSLATPHVIETVASQIGTATLQELKDQVIQIYNWRRQQEQEYGKGVKPFNVDKAIEQVKACDSKGELLDMLENKANKYHETIKTEQEDNGLQGLNDDCPLE